MRAIWRRVFVRLVAVLAMLVACGGLAALVYVDRQVDRVERAGKVQILRLGDALDRVATSLDTAQQSAAGAAGTVAEARTTLAAAASSTVGTARSLEETAGALSANFPETAAGFRNQARDLRALADQLLVTADSLDQNAADLQTFAGDLARLARDLNAVATELRQFAGVGPGAGELAGIVDNVRVLAFGTTGVLLLLLFGVGFSLYLITTDGWSAARRPESPTAGEH